MMEEMADRQVLSRNYAKWKIKYETEQKNGVASLHFKQVEVTVQYFFQTVTAELKYASHCILPFRFISCFVI